MKYADVILPLPLENSYTYSIPNDMEKAVTKGCRVIVPFGKKRYYTAIVIHILEREPISGFDIKPIHALLDPTPIVRRPQLRFWEWIASYYLCKLGDVYKAAIPAGLKLESETVVFINEGFEASAPLRPNEQAVLDTLGGKPNLSVSELEKRTGLRNMMPILTSLLSYGAIMINEEIKQRYLPKKQVFIRLKEHYIDEEKLRLAFDDLKRAKKQEMLLMRYLDLSHIMSQTPTKEVSKKELLDKDGYTPSHLDNLLKRGILECYEKEVGRLRTSFCKLSEPPPLTPAQEKAYDEIHTCFKHKEVCLLHGVTSSGKTEIYARLIDEVLKLGRQVLFLLPEIAITIQLTDRLSKMFGDKLLVYHSKFSDNERVEIWNKLLHSGEPMLVLGVRSSLFLPFRDLGLVIVDEEHENTYKQQDPAPRYHARNAAIVLAGMHGAKTLLGSATPSIDSYFNAISGKYGLVELTVRYGNHLASPNIEVVDIKELKRKKIMKDTLFSPKLTEMISMALAGGEQVLLFQNRRGFAPMLECKSCGYVPHCVNCDVSLTYHKSHNHLTCHYCGYTILLPPVCPACREGELKMMGAGTEKVEEEVKTLFPSAKIERLDFDSARTRTAYERIIQDFENGKANLLIGTQMLSKGLDFSNVSVVGILNADNLMNYPDFRAHERAYQLMTQVSGRAGRRDKRGNVILQTSQTEHPLIEMVRLSAYKDMVRLQLEERKLFRYPPYYRLIVLILRSRDENTLINMSRIYAEKLRSSLGNRVLGPVAPPIARMQTFHIQKIVLKIEISASIAPLRAILETTHQEMLLLPGFKRLVTHYDVDPA